MKKLIAVLAVVLATSACEVTTSHSRAQARRGEGFSTLECYAGTMLVYKGRGQISYSGSRVLVRNKDSVVTRRISGATCVETPE